MEIPTGAFSTVARGAVGKGGDISVTAGSLSLTHGAEMSASTFGQGNAGNVTVRASGVVSFDGVGGNGNSSGVFSIVAPTADGKGGDISVTAETLSLTHGAGLSVSSIGQGGAGDIQVTTHSTRLDEGFIASITASGNGGNIALQAQDLLLLRHGSFISTTAGTANAGGDGGNITINTPFVVAVPKEDSDISANAYTGSGGNIQITTQGLLGIQFRPQDTPLSDITASSQFGTQGIVSISTPGIDPSRGIANLPSQPVDASRQVARSCAADGSGVARGSEFVVTGRGGLPPTPRETLSDDTVMEDWGTHTLAAASSPQVEQTLSVKRSYPASAAKPEALGNHSPASINATVATVPSPKPIPLVEAQGWVYGPNGEVILTAALANSHYRLQPVTSCGQLNKEH